MVGGVVFWVALLFASREHDVRMGSKFLSHEFFYFWTDCVCMNGWWWTHVL